MCNIDKWFKEHGYRKTMDTTTIVEYRKMIEADDATTRRKEVVLSIYSESSSPNYSNYSVSKYGILHPEGTRSGMSITKDELEHLRDKAIMLKKRYTDKESKLEDFSTHLVINE